MLITLLFSLTAHAFEDFYQQNWVVRNSPLDATLVNRDHLGALYRQRDFQFIWFSPQASQQLEAQLSFLYYSNISPDFSKRYEKLRMYRLQHDMFSYDILATDTLINYVSYVKSAAAEGGSWYYTAPVSQPLSGFDTKDFQALVNAINGQKLEQYIHSFAPPNFDYYQSAAKDLIHFIGLGDTGVYHQRGLKRKGDALKSKPELLNRLEVAGMDISAVNRENRLFDKPLERVVKAFQKQHGIKVDGIIGENTLGWLNFPLEDRLRSLAINAERARLVPKKRDSLIVVNVPGFNLSYWHEGEPVFSAKVIVGQQERKTPIMNIRLYSMVVNPTWNVPKKIFYEDLLPKIQHDLTYLENFHFKILKNGYDGEEVDPTTIEWQNYTEDTYFPYQVRQDAGARNALGYYKFNTPNNHAIYLHDTPSKYLFDTDTRTYSSGCIRIQHAEKFASILLETQGIKSDLIEVKESNEKVSIPMKKSIPVSIIYQTAWYQSGYINYRKDVYEYDMRKGELNNKEDFSVILSNYQ
ncbi:L,D-transpeptidase family protein [Vibrio sp. JC009]|uniref:L,D-transpeptidase family protein n=1 Tax=Vibrio sp. JC009 TaxID=2912314 RepID=UPI0023B09F05|nr:L,D-transpeptidase family protein [Vibrio sp. JC009]WED20579.1 L,D-transpeptidase family protein [Vibrio sp. JC009]